MRCSVLNFQDWLFLRGLRCSFFFRALQAALGIPLQLYAPYFCPGSPYFKRNNASSKW